MANLERFSLTFSPKPSEAPGKFTAVAYSGDIIPDYGWMGDVAIDLATLKNPSGRVPALVDHDRRVDKIAGFGQLSVDSNALSISGELTEATEAGRTISALLGANYPLQMSAGISGKPVELKAPEVINGRMLSVRYVFRNAEVHEVSFVPIGADSQTSAQAAFSSQETNAMPRSAEDQELIDAQAAEIAALKAQIDDLTTQVQAQVKMARMTALTALFADVGKDVPTQEDALAPYLSMTDAAFSAYAADLRALRPHHDSSLFARQKDDSDRSSGESLLIAEAKRRAA